MKVIICEKPSLARNVANAIGVNTKKIGYLEGKEFIVTWAFGHLFELQDMKDYSEYNNLKWKDIDTPIIPRPFKYKLKKDEGVVKQFDIIKNLLSRKDVDTVINCGDADREGQLIIDNIIKNCNYNGEIKRLWLPEQTEESIREQIDKMDDNSNYEKLYNEGLARTYMDWLLGINLTVLLTNKTGTLLKAGRVLIPIVKKIYDRDMEIRDFLSKKYYVLENTKNVKLTVKDKFNNNDEILEKMRNELNYNKARIQDIQEKEVIRKPKKLFSLSTLQSTLSKKHNISFKASLDIIQTLYEKGHLTYPRTNTEYLAEEEKGKVKDLIRTLRTNNYEHIDFKDNKAIFDSSKVESHSAIIPTKKLPNLKDLNDKEKIVYTTVLNRFLANFTDEDATLKVRTMRIRVGEQEFRVKGTTVYKKGYLIFEHENIDNELPNFNKGDNFEVDFKIVEKETKAPPKITESSLSDYLKNPLKDMKNEEEEEEEENIEEREVDTEEENDTEEYIQILKGIEIGTEATRTGIIENTKKIGYIIQDKKSLNITELGIKFIETLEKLRINLYVDKTIEFSKILKQVYNREVNIDNVIRMVQKELEEIFNKKVEIEKIDLNSKYIGECPYCKGKVFMRKSKKGDIYYACENTKENCHFIVFEKTKYFKESVKITEDNMKDFLEKGKAKLKIGKTQNFYKFKENEWNGKIYIGLEKIKEDKKV